MAQAFPGIARNEGREEYMRTIRLFDLLMGFSAALDMVTPVLAGHHARVAYLSVMLSQKIGMGKATRMQLLLAAMVHDIGAVPLKTDTRDLIFEINEVPHCNAGWAFCKTAGLPSLVCDMVLHHHTPWDKAHERDVKASLGNLIHLADRLDIALRTRKKADFAAVAHGLCRQNDKFAPRHLAALRELAQDQEAVQRLFEPARMTRCLDEIFSEVLLGPRQLLKLCNLFSLIIDSKSHFTATHSSGVAHTARALLKKSGLADPEALSTIFAAGLLHDLGKLAVPLEILEKPAAVTSAEFEIIQQHARIGLQLMASIRGFACIRQWGGLHHERLNGQGYPLGLRAHQISLPARIMAVADVFTALAEDRPYRSGMEPHKALEVMWDMTRQHALDTDIVALLAAHVTAVNRARIHGQRKAAQNFLQLRALCDQIRDAQAEDAPLRDEPAQS